MDSYKRSTQVERGETKELLTELTDAADEATRNHKCWPKAPNALSRRMNRLAGRDTSPSWSGVAT